MNNFRKFYLGFVIFLLFIISHSAFQGIKEKKYSIQGGMGGYNFFFSEEALKMRDNTQFTRNKWNFFLKGSINRQLYSNFALGGYMLWFPDTQKLEGESNFADSFKTKYASSYMNLDAKDFLPEDKSLKKILDKINVSTTKFQFGNISFGPCIGFKLFQGKNFTISLAGHLGLGILYNIQSQIDFDLTILYNNIDNQDNPQNKTAWKNWIKEEYNKLTSSDQDELQQSFKNEIIAYFYNNPTDSKNSEKGNSLSISTKFKTKYYLSYGCGIDFQLNCYGLWDIISWPIDIIVGINYQGINVNNLTIDNVSTSELNSAKKFYDQQQKPYNISDILANYNLFGLSITMRYNF